jgi:hypothetical protein
MVKLSELSGLGVGVSQNPRWIFLLIVSFFAVLVWGCGGGGTTVPPPTQNPAPTISSISPDTAPAESGDLTITATGTGFVSSSAVQWNGAALVTAYISSTSLTAKIPASDLVATGTATVAVENPTPGGGTSTTVNFTISPPPNPVPTLSGLSPNSANAGSAAVTVTATGTGFISGSTVQWNGTALATTYVSSTSLTAQIPGTDLAATGSAKVAVENPTPGGGTSASLPFIINAPTTSLNVLGVEGNDIAWNASLGKFYVAVASDATTNPGTVTVVDPIAGTIGISQQLSTAPTGFAISDDDQYLYTVIDGGATIERLSLPSLAPDIQWSVGTDATSGQPNLVGNIQVQPGAPHTLAASFGQYCSDSVAVYDDGVGRTSVANASNALGNSLQWSADGKELFAAYGVGTDCGYYTTVSDPSLAVIPVTSSGLDTVTFYNGSLLGEGVHLHIDPVSGNAYGDGGTVVSSANDTPLGEYPVAVNLLNYFPGRLSILDPTLKRFYTLAEISLPGGDAAFRIDVFDQSQFQLLDTIILPNDGGFPTNFLRWGNAGLAFITNGYSSSDQGKLYLLDGGFVNPAATPDTAAGSAVIPVPTLSAISPLTATVGASAVTMTVTGRDFIGQPTVYWNGTALPTTLISATELSAQIPASDLTASTLAAITASNASNGAPGSTSLPFSVNPAPPSGTQMAVYNSGGSDLVWDAAAAKIYVSMPGIQGENGGSIAVVDPVAGTVVNSGYLGSNPDRISLSAGSQYLYTGFDGLNSIEQLTLPGFAVNTQWSLGGDPMFGPYYALDIQAAPGAAETTAVTLAEFNSSPSSQDVVIYDGATPRPTKLSVGAYQYSSLQWAGDDSTIYTVDQSIAQSFLVLGVSSTGVTLSQPYSGILDSYSLSIHYDSGTALVYTDAGQVVQPSNGTIVGNFGASGIAAPDSSLNTVFILGQTSAQTGTSNYTIESFDQKTLAPTGSVVVSNVVGVPTGLIRWGTGGLAFTTIQGYLLQDILTGPGQLYVISGAFVNPSNGANRPASNRPLLPVKRTWDLNAGRRDRRAQPVVHERPIAE